MNFFNPELLLLSGRVALLVLAGSALAFLIGWLWNGRRGAAELTALRGQFDIKSSDTAHLATDELARAKALNEELGRNLAATENQCMTALEQRDEAERLAVQRAGESRQLKDELAALLGRETVPKNVHESVVQELQSLKDRLPAQAPQAEVQALADLKQKLDDVRSALEAREHDLAEAVKEKEALHLQLQALQSTHASTIAEIAGLQRQVSDAEETARHKQVQLDQLAREKAEAELALKTRIAELEAGASVVAALPPRSVQLPKPPLPPADVLSTPVDDAFDSFPPAPEAAHRRPLGESLFDEASMASFSPEVPSLDDAQATLEGLALEVQEKDQMVEVLAAEQAQRYDELEAVRRLPSGEKHEKLHSAEKAEHAAVTRLATTIAERDRCRRQVRALTRSLALAAEHANRADDLTRIKGIKGGISQQLHAFGIFTYRQIVEWDEEDMLAFSELLAFKNRLHRDKWQDQARALMETKYGKELRH